MDTQLFADMMRRYETGELPWDLPLPPPEVVDLAATLPPGRMLDLGCGPGRACIFLAQHGWRCDGVDFVPGAIELARARAQSTGVAEATQFYVAPVTQLDFLQPPYDLVLDVGCLHAQADKDLDPYARQVERLLRPGGSYLLFAHLANEHLPDERRWISEQTINSLFGPIMVFDRVERGTTTVGDHTRPSAWFWMHRVYDSGAAYEGQDGGAMQRLCVDYASV